MLHLREYPGYKYRPKKRLRSGEEAAKEAVRKEARDRRIIKINSRIKQEQEESMMSAATPPDDAWSPPCSLQESPPPTHSSFLGSEGSRRLASPVSFHQCAGGSGQTGYKFESPHGEVPCSPPLNRSSANVSFTKFSSLSCHHLFLVSAQSCVAISYLSSVLRCYFISQLSLA